MITFNQRKVWAFIITLSGIVLNAYANTLPGPGFVYPPHHIKPNMSNTKALGLIPLQVQKAYGFDLVSSQGAGQIIGIVDAYDHPNIEADLAVFNNTFKLPACTTANGCFTKLYADGTKPVTDPDWALEISLDVEWAHAMAPQAKILLIEASNNSYESLGRAIDLAVKKGATIISMSWGGSELANEINYEHHFQVQNVVFTASSGDSGTGTIYPSASSYVLAVGGTSLSIDATGTYLSEKAWSGSGGGLSRFIKEPSYQNNFPIPRAEQSRGIPDVAYNADPDIGVSVYDTVPLNGSSGWYVIGGTSAGAPQWAALIAVLKSIFPNKVINNDLLYAAAKAGLNENYHDITSGSNGTCHYYCQARSGYDYVTGLGTPRVPDLMHYISQSLTKS